MSKAPANTPEIVHGAYHFTVLASAVEVARKAAAKGGNGLPGGEVKVLNLRWIEVPGLDVAAISPRVQIADLVYTGPVSLKVEGWTLAGVTEWVAPGKGITVSAPGHECPKPADDSCAHCGKDRNRKVTYTAVKGAELLHLGGSCATLYWGGRHVSALLARFDAFKALAVSPEEDVGFGGVGVIDCWGVDHIIALTLDALKVRGYVKADALDNGTKGAVQYLLREHKAPESTKEAVAGAKALIAAACASESGSYWQTVRDLLEADAVPYRALGYMVSAVHVAQTKAREAKAGEPEWVGVEGKRASLTLTLRGRTPSEWGYTSRLVDENENPLVCFGKLLDGWEVGAAKTVTCFVKKHDTYRGRKSTIINRLKEA